MSTLAVHFSSASDEWGTPWPLFNRLHSEFGFVLDVAASPENAKCARYLTLADDSLARDWAAEIQKEREREDRRG